MGGRSAAWLKPSPDTKPFRLRRLERDQAKGWVPRSSAGAGRKAKSNATAGPSTRFGATMRQNSLRMTNQKRERMKHPVSQVSESRPGAPISVEEHTSMAPRAEPEFTCRSEESSMWLLLPPQGQRTVLGDPVEEKAAQRQAVTKLAERNHFLCFEAAGAKALAHFAPLTARLKPCPCYKTQFQQSFVTA
jgi:hypothetical protein